MVQLTMQEVVRSVRCSAGSWGCCRSVVAAVGMLVFGGCAATESSPTTGPTTLRGTVSVQTESGVTKAVGREVVLSKPDSSAVVAAEVVCTRAVELKERLRLRVAGQRAVLATELPLEKQIQVWGEYLTEGVRAALEFQQPRVAAAVTDSNGEFTFAEVPAGVYVATTNLVTPTAKYAWTAIVNVKAHVPNSVDLGNSVATGSTVCAAVAEMRQHLAGAH